MLAFKRKKGFLVVLEDKSVLLRCCGLTVSALVILIVRLSIMNFEGPVFTKFDNPAAFASNFLQRVITWKFLQIHRKHNYFLFPDFVVQLHLLS